MAFTLTSELNISLPKNLNSLINDLNKRLSAVGTNLNIKISPQTVKDIAKITQQLHIARTKAHELTNEFEEFGASISSSVKKFAGYTVAAGSFYAFVSALQNSVKDAISFQNEIVKISQVTGETTKDIKPLINEIGRLATTYGVSSQKILTTTQTLAQAGLATKDIKIALEALAKTDIAPTFSNMEETAEAAIAAMAQFKIEAKDLEKTLGSINSVSAKFAVESSDLAIAIRRTGSAFQASGGSLEELLALFTSVRATTRESAETISTGFRTIFTRLQRNRTQNFLKDFGIELRDLEGNFVGPYEAVRRLSTALKDLETTDPRFNAIIEELGGFRQISKVIPLIQQFEVAEKALIIAQTGRASLTQDAAKAQESYAVQIQKVAESFHQLTRTIANNDSFVLTIKLALKMADAFIKVAETVEPLIPLIGGLLAVRGGSAIASIGSGLAKKLNTPHFAKGGLVPGTGNSDSVLANLTPGEYVLKKDAVKAIGTNNLANLNKYANGGIVGGAFLTSDNPANQEFLDQKTIKVKGKDFDIQIVGGVLNKNSDDIKKYIEGELRQIVDNSAKALGAGANPFKGPIPNLDSITGGLFEGALASFGPAFTGDQAGIDFPKGIGSLASKFGVDPEIQKLLATKPVDAKKTLNSDSKARLIKKMTTYLEDGFNKRDYDELLYNDEKGFRIENPENSLLQKFKTAINNTNKTIFNSGDLTKLAKQTKIPEDKEDFYINKLFNYNGRTTKYTKAFASGGIIPGKDSIPALVMPGEYIVNKDSAKAIGKDNLDKLNNIKKFATGGATGNIPGGASTLAVGSSLIAPLLLGFTNANSELSKFITTLTSAGVQFTVLQSILTSLQSTAKVSKKLQIEENNAKLEDAKIVKQAIREKMKVVYEDIKTKQATTHSSGGLIYPNMNDEKKEYSALRAQIKELKINELQNETKSLESQQNKLDKLNNVVAGAGAIASIVSSLASNFSQKQLASGNYGAARASSVVGGALQGAVSGAAVGSLSANPIGIGVGAAIGLVAGVALSLQEANDEIRKLQFGKTASSFSNFLKGIVSSNAKDIEATSLRARFITSDLQRSKSFGERQERVSQLQGSATELYSIIAEISKTSTSFNELNNKIPDVVRLFTELTQSSPEDVKKQIDKQILISKKYTELSNAISKEAVELFTSLSKARTIGSGLKESNQTSSNRLSGLEARAGGAISSSSVGQFLRTSENNRAIDFIINKASPQGSLNPLSSQAKDIFNLRKILPGIITGLSQDSSLDKESFKNRLSDKLNKNGVGVGSRLSVINQLSNLLGVNEDEGKLNREIFADMDKTIERLLSGLSKSEEAIKELANIIDDNTKIHSSILNKRNETILSQDDKQRNIIDTNFAIADFQESLTDTPLNTDTLRRKQSIDDIRYGNINTIDGQGYLNNIKRLEDDRNGINSLGSLDKANISLSVDRTSKALDFFSNVANRASQAYAEAIINQEKQNSLVNQNAALQYATGSASDRRKQIRIESAAQTAISTGSLDGVRRSLKSDVVSFLKERANFDFGEGKTGKTVLEAIARNNGGGRFTGEVSDLQQNAQATIFDNYQQALQAQQLQQEKLIADETSASLAFNAAVNNFQEAVTQFNQQVVDEAKQAEDEQKQIQAVAAAKKVQEEKVKNDFAKQHNVTDPKRLDTLGDTNALRNKILEAEKNNHRLSKIDPNQKGYTGAFLKNSLLPIASFLPSFINKPVSQDFVANSESKLKKEFGDTFASTYSQNIINRDEEGNVSETTVANAFLTAAQELENTTNALNTDVAAELRKLSEQLGLNIEQTKQLILDRQGFAAGGSVLGVGNTDSVPANLMPGEFVLNKTAVRAIGVNKLNNINRQGFANGGLVGINNNQVLLMNPEALAAFNNFANSVGILSKSLDNFPREVTMSVQHNVNVIHNGAQVFSNMEDSVKNLVEITVNNAINKMLAAKFPDAGRF